MPTELVTNGSFEEPQVRDKIGRLHDASGGSPALRGWFTTASDKMIDIWSSGAIDPTTKKEVLSDPGLGTQFAALLYQDRLYQDLQTSPGTKLTWSLSHRGRFDSATTVLVLIGPTEGKLVKQPPITDDNTAWRHYTGDYTVPAGQILTRFAIESLDATSGDPTIGNFLDGVSITTDDGKANMIIDHGKSEKKAGVSELRIDFNQQFSKPPTVVISNNWEDVRDNAGFHNILTIEHDHFVVFSGFAANNFFIQWIAVAAS